MPWNIPNIWEGGECFIIGGGPSMLKQFNVPKGLIQQVRDKKVSPAVYSPYLSPLHDRHIIGVNAAYLIGSWIEVCFFGDSGFFLKNLTGLIKYPGLKVSSNSVVRGYRWVKYVKQSRQLYGLSKSKTELCWGLNSGAAAINLAVHFGAKRIILLGFDMTLLNDGQSHWHNEYRKKEEQEYQHSFAKHLRAFPPIALAAKKMKIEIINANSDSGLKDFPRVELNTIL